MLEDTGPGRRHRDRGGLRPRPRQGPRQRTAQATAIERRTGSDEWLVMLVSSGAHDGPSTRLPRQCQAALAKYEAARLTGRGLEHHAPCVWRALPIQEWVAWLTGGYETPLEEWIGGITSAPRAGSSRGWESDLRQSYRLPVTPGRATNRGSSLGGVLPMRTIARAGFPVLALLLLASYASAQDMPDIVRIDMDLHWTVPVYGAISLSGSSEWQNGVGFVNKSLKPAGLPGVLTGWFSSRRTDTGPFVIDLESSMDHPRGEPLFIVPFTGQSFPFIKPGDYAIGAAAFSDPGVSLSAFLADSGSLRVVAVPEFRILPRVIRLGLGLDLDGKLTRGLQRTTTWLAAKLLGARHDATKLYLQNVTVEVISWCAGRELLFLLLVGALILAVCPMSLPQRALLIFAAVVIAIETNGLRVATLALWLDRVGAAVRERKAVCGAHGLRDRGGAGNRLAAVRQRGSRCHTSSPRIVRRLGSDAARPGAGPFAFGLALSCLSSRPAR